MIHTHETCAQCGRKAFAKILDYGDDRDEDCKGRHYVSACHEADLLCDGEIVTVEHLDSLAEEAKWEGKNEKP